jgi:c-di-GMP-binding flagellar brake protein YcgR
MKFKQKDTIEIRRYVRSVMGIPVEVKIDYSDNLDDDDDTITNISLGGLALVSEDPIDLNESIRVACPHLNNDAKLSGKVIWCQKSRQGYEIGLDFDDPTALERMKIIDQTIDIERFRKTVEDREGRQLSDEQATKEWVSRYTGTFSATK